MQGNHIKRSEFWGAMILLALHAVLFPIALSQLSPELDRYLSPAKQNLLYYGVSTVLVFLSLGSFLRREFDNFLDHFFRCLVIMALGAGLYWLLNVITGAVFDNFLPGLANPNDETVKLFANGPDRGSAIALTVFLAPIVEEAIFRGGLFAGTARKRMLPAYVLSMLLFALYHVWQYALAYADPRYFIFMLQYLPAGFVLCWVYARSGSLWSSVVLHMLLNLYTVMHT